MAICSTPKTTIIPPGFKNKILFKKQRDEEGGVESVIRHFPRRISY